MPNDHRGITLVELIIAIAISTVILGAATLFLGMAHKNYNHASAQIDLQSESQILMEQIGMWVMEGNRVEELDPSVSGVRGIAIYTIPNTPSVTNPAGAAAPEAASKRVIWISAGGKKLYTKKMAVADPKTDTTVISAATDEVQENLIGEYVTAFTGTVNASTEKASVAVSFDMQYLEQKYTIQNEFIQFQRFLIISFRSCFIKTTQLPVDVLVGIGGGTDRRTVIIRVFFRKEYSIRHRLFPFQ